jgi:hypothetical protein
MYHSPLLWLGDAVRLIARQLAKERPTEFADEASALDIARRQLVRGLFDGQVHAEGVWWTDSGPNDPLEPPEPEEWRQIEAGWWSHERYEPYVVYPPDPSIQSLLRQENSETQRPDLLAPQVIEGRHILDIMVVGWDAHSCEPIVGVGQVVTWERIRVRRADIEAQFGVRELELPHDTGVSDQIGQIEEGTETAVVTEPKRTRPPDVRDPLHMWLGQCLQNNGDDWFKNKTHSMLSRKYSKTRSEDVSDYVRKAIAEWRKERGLGPK